MVCSQMITQLYKTVHFLMCIIRLMLYTPDYRLQFNHNTELVKFSHVMPCQTTT